MSENRFTCQSSVGGRDTVCIEANRVLDSCRDRDCYENVRVFLGGFGNDIIERTGNIRVKSSCIAQSNITVDPIPFNRGFYSVNIRLYIRMGFEACLGGGRPQEFDGVAVVEKNVILFGGESNLNVFRSTGNTDICDGGENICCSEGNLPTAVVEAVDPIILSARIMEKRQGCRCVCCCSCSDIPETVARCTGGQLDEGGERFLAVSLGIFSVIRIVRPAQYLINASEYVVPDKECPPRSEESPCDAFRCMAFPVQEFTAGTIPPARPSRCGEKPCGT